MKTRRQFIKIAALTPLCGAGNLILFPQEAEAFWPLLARIALGGFFRRTVASTVTRAVGGNLARQVALSSGRRLAVQGSRRYITKKVVTKYGISIGGALSISPDIYAMAKEHNAGAIWINRGHENLFDVEFNNDTDDYKAGQLSLFIKDIEKDKIREQIYGGYVSAPPSRKFVFPFEISELPFTGAINIVSETTDNNIACTPSDNIIVAREEDVRFG